MNRGKAYIFSKNCVSESGALLVCKQLSLPTYPDRNMWVSVFALTSVRIYKPEC